MIECDKIRVGSLIVGNKNLGYFNGFIFLIYKIKFCYSDKSYRVFCLKTNQKYTFYLQNVKENYDIIQY